MSGSPTINLEKLANPAEFDDESLMNLLRSLGTKRTIAFLGAGISVPYGGIPWSVLVEKTKNEALDILSTTLEKSNIEPRLRSRIERVQDRIREAPAGNDVKPEQNLTQLELLRLAFDLAQKVSPDSPNFKSVIARLTRSDVVVARDNVYNRLDRFGRALGINARKSGELLPKQLRGALGRSAKGDRHNQKFFDYQALYSVKTIEELIASVKKLTPANHDHSPLIAALGKIKGAIEDDARRAGRNPEIGGLPPDRRSFFSLVFAMISISFLRPIATPEDRKALYKHIITGAWAPKGSFIIDGSDEEIPSTSNEIRPRTDPIQDIIQKLDFWRFLTTNYDFEVERLLEFVNFPRGTLAERQDLPKRPVPERVDPHTDARSSRSFLGSPASSNIVSEKSIGELIGFAICSNDMGARVTHLHGRADKPDTIIATESDYQSLYIPPKASGGAFSNTLSMVFSGNPILFIGSSVSEHDILRPLREFVSRHDAGGRELYALMPALESRGKRDGVKVDAFLRYGVRVLFYGEKKDDALDPWDRIPTNTDIRFNARQLAPLDHGLSAAIAEQSRLKSKIGILIGFIKKIMPTGKEPSAYDIERAQHAYNYLRLDDEKLDELTKSRVNPSLPDGRLFSTDIAFGDATIKDRLSIDHLAFESCLVAIRGLLSDIELEVGDPYPGVLKIKESMMPPPGHSIKAADQRHTRLINILELMIDFLDQLGSKLISNCLDIALGQLADMRSDWWRDVRALPPRRVTADPKGLLPKEKTAVFQRHAIVWPSQDSEDTHAVSVENVLQLLHVPAGAAPLPKGRLLYCYSQKGVGKGSFFFELMERLLKESKIPSTDTVQYSHFWTTNLSHSIEFSSSLVGIGNFIKCLALDLDGVLTEQEAIELRNDVGHLEFIKQVSARIKNHTLSTCHPPKIRGIIGIAGFERLLGTNGFCQTIEIEQICAIFCDLVRNSGIIDVIIVSGHNDIPGEVLRPPTEKGSGGGPNSDIPGWFDRDTLQVGHPLDNAPPRIRDYGDALKVNIQPVAPDVKKDASLENDPYAEALDRLRKQLGQSRYMQRMIDRLLGDDAKWGVDRASSGEAKSRKTRWVRTLIDRVQASSPDNLSFRVIAAVLDQYGLQADSDMGVIDYQSRIDFLILQNIAYFGYPTQGFVLIRAPMIKNYLKYYVTEVLQKKEDARAVLTEMINVVEASLSRLLDRNLLGAIAPREYADWRGGADISPEDRRLHDVKQYTDDTETISLLRKGYRFVLHPSMKRYILRNFAFREAEYGYSNTFIISIYAAQPTDVALLENDVQGRIDDLIDELIEPWRAYDIMPLDELVEFSEHTASRAQCVHPDQIKQLKMVAKGFAPVDADGNAIVTTEREVDRFNVSDDYLHRAKTAKGLLARASADMPGCFRAAYGIIRQMRPFAVLVRTDETDLQNSPVETFSPFDRTSQRLKRLQEGLVSARQARQVATNIARSENENGTFDQKIYAPMVSKSEWKKIHPVNTFGPLLRPEEALYPHEMAWLWNERGVIAFAQGKMYDAIPYYQLALRAMEEHEGAPHPLGPGAARIRLNIAIAEIERGNLRRADKLLDEVLTYSQEFNPFEQGEEASDDRERQSTKANNVLSASEGVQKRHVVGPIAKGYKGLIRHLQGDVKAAIGYYNLAIKKLTPQSRSRALSIFHKHLGDAYGKVGGSTKPEMDPQLHIDRAIASAQSMMQIDQVHFARLSQVRLLLMTDSAESYRNASVIIDQVMAYASSMNLFRLQSEALFYDARLKMQQRELDLACEAASESVAIATRYGMKMRRISSSILLGEIYCANKDTSTGHRLLNDAAIDAQKVGYQLALERKQEADFKYRS